MSSEDTQKQVYGHVDLGDSFAHLNDMNNMPRLSDNMFEARDKFIEAKVQENYVKEELELEMLKLQLSARERLMKVKRETDKAEIEYRLASGTSKEDIDSIVNGQKEYREFDAFANCSFNNWTDSQVGTRKVLEVVSGLEHSLKTLVSCLELPKCEMIYFDGDPVSYWQFISMFESNIETRAVDDATKLRHLIHYCRGKARKVVENFVMLKPCEGYKAAREALSKRFGQRHIIAAALIERVTSGPAIASTDGEGLSNLCIDIRNCEVTLKQMGYMADINCFSNMEKIVNRLPRELQAKWAEVALKIMTSDHEPGLTELLEFVEHAADVANSRYGKLIHAHQFAASKIRAKISSIEVGTSRSQDNYACPVCLQSHVVAECCKFKNLTVKERMDVVRKHRLCSLCLKPYHFARNCPSSYRCGVESCTARHHRLLHIDKSARSFQTINPVEHDSKVNTSTSCFKRDWKVSLCTIPVIVEGPLSSLKTYAFLDSGSDTTLIHSDVAHELGIRGTSAQLNIVTMNRSSVELCERVNFNIKSLVGDEIIEVDEAYTVKDLPTVEPLVWSEKHKCAWPHLKDITLDNLEDKRVSVLIGCNIPEAHWILDNRKGGRRQPYAIKTLLGWMLMGPVGTGYSSGSLNYVTIRDDLCQCFERLVESEFIDHSNSSEEQLSYEESLARSCVEKSVHLVDGHYEISVPWRECLNRLPNNRSLAVVRLNQLKRRLKLNAELYLRYKEVINHYLDMKYIELVAPLQNSAEESRLVWYLPHHPVIHSSKPNKVRVVFDCAAQYNKISLNNAIRQCPDLANYLLGVLCRFRQAEIAIVADIEEMFLQVLLPNNDRNLFRFLWWPDGDMDKDPTEFRWRVHPFGAKSSPFCANFALKQLSVDHNQTYDPLVISILENNFYVDDCLVSVDDPETAIRVVSQLRDLLSKGGFHLTKWLSNNKSVISSLPVEERSTSLMNLDMQKLPVERTLGVEWNIQFDTFGFRVNLPVKPKTRRGILSYVSSLYDPLGLAAPFVLPAKRLLQKLCVEKLGWDEEISSNSMNAWDAWVDNIGNLKDVFIPRCLKPPQFVIKISQLHVFSDASTLGYGIAAYVRFVSVEGKVHCALAFGKSRVAPLRCITIPRLELQAAVLAARVSCRLQREFQWQFDQTYMWTDSVIVLAYIQNVCSKFKTYVANRVSTILQNTKLDQWHHVDSSENPADLASRGFIKFQRNDMLFWFNGPSFLWNDETLWSDHKISEFHLPENDVEIKKIVCVTSVPDSYAWFQRLCLHFSSWFKLQKAVAWLRRFKEYLIILFSKRPKESIRVGFLTISDLKAASRDIIVLVQMTDFSAELKYLQKVRNTDNLSVTKLGRLKKLCPILCDGLICIGSRFTGNVGSLASHPIILPSNHPVTELIVRECHLHEGHMGTTQVLSALRQKYWVLKGRATVRRIIGRCIICREQSAALGQQLMAPMPRSRLVANEPPFTCCGVDYFGPFMVKRGRSVQKLYGCLFTCLRIRAVHIEVAYSMTTDSFISAFLRFVSRRGTPRELFSDNGTNFRGAEREIKEMMQGWNQHSLSVGLLQKGVEWHFNPPESSHRGGVWERMIRSIRRILGSILREQTVTDETLITALAEVERILNDRPLVPLNEDPQDLSVLTPSSLLLLRDNICAAPCPVVNTDRYRCTWKRAQYITDVFWRRWLREYLPTLQTRTRWLNKSRNFKAGDLVMIFDNKASKGKWPKGIVERVFTGEDQLVRRLEIRTTSGIIMRDIRKVCLLEGDGE